MTKEFKPTWLYVKQHNQTGLKYFGKTVAKDPKKYKGSGIHWLNHLKKHGNDVSTIWCHLYSDKEEIFEEATAFSKSHCIVESRSWANHQMETGLGINIQRTKSYYSPERKEKYRQMMLGNLINKNRVQPEEEKQKRANALLEAYRSGRRVVSDTMRKIMSKTHKNKIVTEKTRLKMSESATIAKAWRRGKTNEEIYGIEKAAEIKLKKSNLPAPNRTPITINGITYDSIRSAAVALNTTEYKAKKLSVSK